MSKLSDIRSLENMRMGVRYRAPVSINNFTVYLRPLTSQEMIEVTSKTRAEMQLVPEDQRNAILEHTILARKTLVLASQEYGSEKLGELSETMLKHFTPDELSYLYDEYNFICEKASPRFEEITVDELNAIMETLKKKSSLARDLSFKQLVGVCQRLISLKGD